MHGSSNESVVRTQLRQSLTSIEQELQSLSLQEGTEASRKSVAEIRSSWSTLVRLLALGPEPEVRACPGCQHTIMREAKICGYCWMKLEPLAATDAAAPRT